MFFHLIQYPQHSTLKQNKIERNRNIMKITHIYHSGFCIELEQTILIFDWYTGILPELPEEKQVVVFVSHGHGDHFGDCIWSLKKRFRKLIYVIDSTTSVLPGTRNVKTVEPGGTYNIADLTVQTLRSTDQGSAFLVEAEGHKIFHAGDLNVWYWYDEPEEENLASEADCRREYEKLAGQPADVAFLPLDPRLREHAPRGIALFMECAGAREIFPMHYWDRKVEAETYLKDPRLAPFADRIHFEDFFVI